MKKDIAVKQLYSSPKLFPKITAIADLYPPVACIVVVTIDDRNLAKDLLQLILNTAGLFKLSLPVEKKGS